MDGRGLIPPDFGRTLEHIDAPVPVFEGLRPAAVVALLLEDSGQAPRVVLIERSSSLRAHAGQLAFPGGKPEPVDAALVDTALREANEEVGLPVEDTTVVGRLSPVPTPTGFCIIPFVGWAPPGWTPQNLSPEVARIITPSLATLADPDVHRITGRGTWRGFRYEMHEFAIHEPPLWGATARMVWDLLQRIRDE